MENGAKLDKERKYRYSLTREWAPNKQKVVFICLNPSTADETTDDNTLKKCIKFAKGWHSGRYGSLELVNLFAYRATEPKELKQVDDPVGVDNDTFILEAVKSSNLIVAAWGVKEKIVNNRHLEVLDMLQKEGLQPYCLEYLKGNMPRHPLYANGKLVPIPYSFESMRQGVPMAEQHTITM